MTQLTGRPVFLAEIVAAHPKFPDGCLCGGTGEVQILKAGRSGTGYCLRAVDELQRRYGESICSVPLDPHWIEVTEPDAWAFTRMFAAGMKSRALEEPLRAHYRTEAGRWILAESAT